MINFKQSKKIVLCTLTLVFGGLFNHLPTWANIEGKNQVDEYCYNPYYYSKDFAESHSKFFLALPKIKQEMALKLAKQDPLFQTKLKKDSNYFVRLIDQPCTKNQGKTWSYWKVAIARVVMNRTLRIDYSFKIDAMTGEVHFLKDAPVKYIAFSPN